MSLESMNTAPSEGSTILLTMRIKVVLPDPDRPIKTVIL
jgi:hypothetical protein